MYQTSVIENYANIKRYKKLYCYIYKKIRKTGL